MSKDEVNPPFLKDAAAVALHLKEGDILVLKLDHEWSPEQLDHCHRQLRRIIDMTGRKNVACTIMQPGMDLDTVAGDKKLASMQHEIDELKATVAKYLEKK